MRVDTRVSAPGPIPARAGIGLRAPHRRELLQRRAAAPWLEVHSENYFAEGGRAAAELDELRQHYPLSFHGVGLSLGSADPLNTEHLAHLQRAVERYAPALVSEHLCWVSYGGSYLHDLLPLPYTEEALAHVVPRIALVQETLGRQILIENVSSYLEFEHSAIPEWEFLREVAARSGCGILLDVNNVYVSAANHGFDPDEYLRGLPMERVVQLHVAGHTNHGTHLVDTHVGPVPEPVWRLLARACELGARAPVLLEWDAEIPSFDVVHAEALKARALVECNHTMDAA